ncbi:hypothetical protein [Comamonas endophytica]|uniref:Uncharacterized protein n=1 Tax=Comamonas endophytica TaxID=2949090 RepID=A0ABY6G8L4_9BURK|nr:MULTISPECIES: hypothetical protein [unclassified Acidovorax]MCD2514226.1 hypothetical protein [Acidovorax sp. D4N7]UYG51365.1 hypothetical protein M9799_15075 [Acidovorax sp. 5MLIR]
MNRYQDLLEKQLMGVAPAEALLENYKDERVELAIDSAMQWDKEHP